MTSLVSRLWDPFYKQKSKGTWKIPQGPEEAVRIGPTYVCSSAALALKKAHARLERRPMSHKGALALL